MSKLRLAMMESNNYMKTSKPIKRKLKELANEMLERDITEEQLLDFSKPGVLDMVEKVGLTYGELALAQQMYKATHEGNLKSFEFIRDTAGQKPSEKIEQTTTTNNLQDINMDDLEKMLAYYKELEKSHTKLEEENGEIDG